MDEEIQVVSFDMDGTLISKRFADDFWLEEIPKLYSEKRGLALEEAKVELMEEYDEMGKEDVRWYKPEYWFSRCGLDEDPRELLEELRKRYELYDDAKETIERLSGEYDLIVVSNGIKMFIEVGLGDHRRYFHSLYSSVSDFGCSSKTPEIYRKVCDDLGVEPDRVVHVGDDIRNDHEPAEEAGMKAYLIDRESRGDGLKDLRELLDLL